MSNPFERHGIDHLSPSSLNCYTEQPAFWALKYLWGFREEGNPSMWRGSAVEAGLDYYLFERNLDLSIEVALRRFEDDAMGVIDDETEKERKAVPLMVEQAAIAVAGWDAPDARQVKVEHWFDGIEVPVVGYADYLWPVRGRELKSTHRMPSEIPGSHARQASTYSVCKSRPWDLLYVTTKKAEIKELQDERTHLKRLEWSAHAIRRVLSVFPDKQDATRIFTPDFDHFYWKPAAIEAAKPIWG